MLRSLVVTFLLTLPTSLLAAKPVPCAGGRFLVAGAAALAGALPERGIDAVTVADGAVGIESGCAAKTARVKPGKKATLVAVTWK